MALRGKSPHGNKNILRRSINRERMPVLRDLMVNSTPPPDLTQLLLAWNNGDRAALDRLMAVVYDELRRFARRYMRQEDPAHTLQATALVNHLYIRLVDQKRVNWQNRAHFFGAASQMIRRLLVDHARCAPSAQTRRQCVESNSS